MAGYAEGSAYAPLLEGGQPTYAAVCCDDLILSYIVNLPLTASFDLAQLAAEGELPSDAIGGEIVDLGECRVQEWRSPTAVAVLENGFIPHVAYIEPDPTYPPDEQRWWIVLSITRPGEDVFC